MSLDNNTSRKREGKNLDNVDFTNRKIRVQTPHSKMVLLELGLEEDKLYKITKKEYLDNHPELKQEKTEIQDKRYEHYEKRRQEAIDQARQIRTDIIAKENEMGEEGMEGGKTGKFSTTGFKSSKNEENKKNEAQQSGMIKKELEKLELIKKQQLGEIKNLIDYEYNLNETRKKNQQKEKEKEEKEEKMRKEKIKLQKLKEQKIKEKEEEKKEKQRKEEEEAIKKRGNERIN